MTIRQPTEERVSAAALWFGFLGGGIAWFTHLLLAWAFSEWGGVSRFPGFHLLGINGTSWLLLLLSAVTISIAAAAAWVSLVNARRLGSSQHSDGRAAAGCGLARAGWILSGAFVFVILVQSIPIFFFLERHST